MGNVTETDAAIISDAELDKEISDVLDCNQCHYQTACKEKRSQPYVKGGKRR